MVMSEPDPGLLLKGLDGGNPLGFLASIGTLRAVSEADSSVNWRMRWEVNGGYWSPVLMGDGPLTEDTLIDLLVPVLRQVKMDPPLHSYKNLTINPKDFRDVARDAQTRATFADRHCADFVAAFGCDILSVSGKEPGNIQDTALRTMSGAGHQHFLDSMRDLAKKTEPDHLRSSLFETWRYADDKPNLRWDPMDDRRHALRWREPSDDPIRTMRGANRLAVEALPLLPTAPSQRELHTTGFSQRRGEGVLFSWPIWEVPLSIDIVRSLLSMAELKKPEPNRDILLRMGVVEIYRSQRITRDKYRNFTPAVPV